MAQLKILYFASLRESLGRDRDHIEVDESVRTVAQLKQWLIDHEPVVGALLGATSNLRVAVDQQLACDDTSVQGAGEVAFFPPVTGG